MSLIQDKDRLNIYIPTVQDLIFKQQMSADKDTMSYLIGTPPFENFNPKDGTIKFPTEQFESFLQQWTQKEGSFYAYLVRQDGNFVGDICYRYDKNKGMTGIYFVIHAKYRGLGYGKQAITLLCQKAKQDGYLKLYNQVPLNNQVAIKVHKFAGFKEVEKDKCICTFVLDMTK